MLRIKTMSFKKKIWGPGEVAQQLKALVALAEGMCSIPGDLSLSSGPRGYCTHNACIYIPGNRTLVKSEGD